MSPTRDLPVTVHARAFTLAELVIALGVSSILVVGAGVVLTSTMSQTDRGAGELAAQAKVSDALSTIAADASVATSITSPSPNMLWLTVPDRNNDGAEEQIEYRTDADAAGLLFRSVNGQQHTLADQITEFAISTHSRPPPQDEVLASQELVVYNPSSGKSAVAFGGADRVAVCLLPTFPAGTISWSIQKVRIPFSTRGSADAIILAEVRSAPDDTAPGPTVYAQTVVLELVLSGSESDVELSLSTPSLDPAAPVWLVLYTLPNINEKVNIHLQSGSNPPGWQFVRSSADSGVTWITPATNYAVPIQVVGSYTVRTEQ